MHNRETIIYVLSLYLRIDYKIIEENIIFDDKIYLFNKYIVNITVSDYINLKKFDSTKFKYLEINFVINNSDFFEETIYVKQFDNVEIHYINLEIILRNIYNKSKIELNDFERFIILITSSNRDEIKSVINNKNLYIMYKNMLELNTNEIKMLYENDIKEKVDFESYKKQIILEVRRRLIKYLDITKVEEVLDL